MIVSGIGTEQLLRVPKINTVTGEAQASAVIIYTDDWCLRRKIKGMCFDKHNEQYWTESLDVNSDRKGAWSELTSSSRSSLRDVNCC